MQEFHHYHLFATKVVFEDEPNSARGAVELNVLIRTESKFITAFDIGRAQQVAQAQFFERVEDKTLKVVDVFTLSVSYLGKMTEAQFQYRPTDKKSVEALFPHSVPDPDSPFN